MTKPTLSRILSIVLTAVIALAAVFGYDIAVTQPRERGEGGINQLTTGFSRAIGDNVTNLTNLVLEGYAVVSAPTAIATATPAMLINSAGVSNLLSLRTNSTPVFQVSAAGVVNGQVLRYASTGQKIICGSTTITGTGALPHGLATPTYVQLSLAQDVTGDCARLSYANSSATVTAKCFNTALTPAAATTPAAVNWCVIGTP